MESLNGKDIDEHEQDSAFAEGFDLDEGENPEGHGLDMGSEPTPDDRQEPTPNDDVLPGGDDRQEPTTAPSVAPVHTAPGPAYVPPVIPEAQEPGPEPVPLRRVEVPEEIAEELEELRKINPQAAELALEDSHDGAAIRKRLEDVGALQAEDRALQILSRREQETLRQTEERQRVQAAVKTHNDHFNATLGRETPGYAAMMRDPNRRTEAVKYQQDIFAWIAAKPYAEAAPLMEVAKFGRDPQQVAALIKQFESERKGAVTAKPDPTGALAVPARGTPSVPAGVGDKDDFDAGWNANPSK